jgi:hypothetical protein
MIHGWESDWDKGFAITDHEDARHAYLSFDTLTIAMPWPCVN